MSVVLVTLAGAPQVSEDAKKKDQELNELIEKKVQGNIYCFLFLIQLILFQRQKLCKSTTTK